MHARIRFRQLQVLICSHSSRALIRPRRPEKDVPGEGVELLDLEQAAPDPAARFRLREVLEDELGLEDAPEIPIGVVEPVFGAEAYQAFHGH